MDMAPNMISDPAPASLSETTSSTLSGTQPPRNLRNPVPLSASQEAQVRDLYHKRVRQKCDPQIKEFAACARGLTVSAMWRCRPQRLAMNSCMVLYATPTEEDAARAEWFSGVEERRQKKEQELEKVEQRRVEVIEMTRLQEEKERRELEEKKRRELSGKADPVEVKKGWWR